MFCKNTEIWFLKTFKNVVHWVLDRYRTQSTYVWLGGQVACVGLIVLGDLRVVGSGLFEYLAAANSLVLKHLGGENKGTAYRGKG